VNSVTRLAVGTYQIQLQDNYAALLSMEVMVQSPAAGAAVTDGSFVVGTVYQIVTVGTTNWTALGVPASITPAPGVVFKAAIIGGAGTGTGKVPGVSGGINAEIIGDASTMLSPTPSAPNLGGYLTLQFIAATSPSVTTPIAADPAAGSVVRMEFILNNSSVQ